MLEFLVLSCQTTDLFHKLHVGLKVLMGFIFPVEIIFYVFIANGLFWNGLANSTKWIKYLCISFFKGFLIFSYFSKFFTWKRRNSLNCLLTIFCISVKGFSKSFFTLSKNTWISFNLLFRLFCIFDFELKCLFIFSFLRWRFFNRFIIGSSPNDSLIRWRVRNIWWFRRG